MKILLISIKSGSGSDVYYRLLKQGLDKYTSIKSDLIFIPHIFEKVFFLIPLYLKYKKIDFDKYDIIHTNAEFGWWFKYKNKPLVVTIHHCPFDREFQKYTNIAQKIFYYFWIKPNFRKSLLIADKIIAVSKYTKNNTISYFKSKKDINVIHNGIDTNFFRPINLKQRNKKTRLLFVGNLTRRKGIDLLPKIMEKLGSDYELCLTLGLRANKIPGYLERENIVLLGKMTNKQLLEEYNKCDILLLPSRLEGFGYSVVEAMACRKPIVATNYSSIREIVKDKGNGYLCNSNDINDFVGKIKITKRRLDNGENFSHNRDYVRGNFSLEIIAKKYNKFYKSLEL